MARRNEAIQRCGKRMVSTLGLLGRTSPSLPHLAKGTVVSGLSKRRTHRVLKNTKHASLGYLVLGRYTKSNTTELSASIRATHEKIQQDALESVALEEQSSNKHLTEIVSCDEEKLSTRRDASQHLSFHCDITEMGGDSSCDIRGIFEESAKNLNALVGEWVKTQRKIACLRVEVVGTGQTTGLGSKKSGISKARFNGAASVARGHQEPEEGVRSMLRIGSEEIQHVTREAASGLKVQGQKWRDETRKLREEMCQLANKMIMSN